VQRLAAQVEEAVLQADIFRVVWLAKHRQWQLARLRQHLDIACKHLDCAGRQVGVHGLFGTRLHLTINPDHPLATHFFSGLEGGAVRVSHDLGHSVMIAQIDEQQATMVAHPVHPARQAGGFTNV
jgi:hypothetical protein